MAARKTRGKNWELSLQAHEMIRAVDAAFNDFNLQLGREFTERITDRRWAWPNETVKYSKGKRRRLKSGKLAKRRVLDVEGSPRDIVDDGQLRDSYKLVRITPHKFDHVYRARYALAVHNGAVIKRGSGRVVLTARPWLRVTLREVDTGKAFQSLLADEIAKIKAVG